MSTTTLLAIIASSWGIAMALSPTLQIRHMIARRSSAGISIPYLGVLVVGFVLWFAYGVALAQLGADHPEHDRVRRRRDDDRRGPALPARGRAKLAVEVVDARSRGEP